MRSTVVFAAIFSISGHAALADPCQDRFTDLYMQLDQGIPTKTVATTAFKGAPPSVNDFLYLNQNHHMTVPTSPAGPWVLTYQNIMYQSGDEGASWAKVRDLDSSQNAEAARAAKTENAATIRNAACAEGEVGGAAVDVVAADITVSQGMVTENRYTYYVRRDDGFIVKAVYDTKAPNFEMVITQEIEKAPGLSLPVPE